MEPVAIAAQLFDRVEALASCRANIDHCLGESLTWRKGCWNGGADQAGAGGYQHPFEPACGIAEVLEALNA